jgi:hypothetical protein
MIAFYTMSLSMKTSKMPYFVDSTDTIIEKIVVTMRTAMKIEEKAGLKGLLVFFYHSSFEALVCKQGVRIVVMTQRKA